MKWEISNSSVSRVEKERSATALSQRFAFRIMLRLMPAAAQSGLECVGRVV